MKTYELVFERKNDDLKVLSFEIHDDRFRDYFIDTLMSNLEYDIADLDIEYETLQSFTIIEKESE